MAPRRCRSCNVLAPGGEVPVVRASEAWADWHLCGHCWGLLIVGLQRSDLGVQRLRIGRSLRDLRLNPDSVRDAIRAGQHAVGDAGLRMTTRGDRMVEQEQRLLVELQALAREVEVSATFGVPREAWGTIRQRILDLRAEVRALRRQYSRGATSK